MASRVVLDPSTSWTPDTGICLRFGWRVGLLSHLGLRLKGVGGAKKGPKGNVDKENQRLLLASRGLPAAAPKPESRWVLRNAIAAGIDNCASCSFREKQWLKSRIHTHVRRKLTFRSMWNHGRVAECANSQVLTQMSEDRLDEALSGTKLSRSEESWGITYRLSPVERQREILSETARVLQGAGLEKRASKSLRDNVARGLRSSKPLQRVGAREAASQAMYARHTKSFQFHLEHSAVVPDDKNQKWAWILKPFSYQVLCLAFVLLYNMELHLIYTGPCKFHLVTSRKSFPWSKPFIATGHCRESLAFAKRVCDNQEQVFLVWLQPGRCCSKIGHSCVRKICSYAARWPKRKVWRLFKRAAEVLVRQMCPSAEVFGLDDASSKVRQGLKLLAMPAEPLRCARCGSKKDAFTAIVADAGQFYEEVQPAQACAALAEIITRAADSGWSGIAVARTRKCFGFLVTHMDNPRSRFALLPLLDIFNLVCAALNICLVSVGQCVAWTRGLPIGGQFSKLASSAVLATEERNWLHSHRTRQNKVFLFAAFLAPYLLPRTLRKRCVPGLACFLPTMPFGYVTLHLFGEV